MEIKANLKLYIAPVTCWFSRFFLFFHEDEY